MAQWRKKFERWENARSPVDKDEVEALLKHVFGERFSAGKGTSHEFQIQCHELQQDMRFQYGHLTIPVRGGQKVIGFYLQRAYEVAKLLGIYPPLSSDDE